jgi:hypothetical protein
MNKSSSHSYNVVRQVASFFLGEGDWVFLETGYCCIAQPNLKLMILMPQLPKSWDYKWASPHPAKLPSFKTKIAFVLLELIFKGMGSRGEQ